MSDQPKVQNRNADMVDLLRTDFVGRNEPNYAWRAACSAVLALPALRAFWPMSSVDYTTASRARDIAGGGYHLSDNNTPTFGYDQLVPYVEFDGTNQYLSRADGGAANWADILGTETYVAATQRGLTLGGWFYFDGAAGGGAEGLIGKASGGAIATLAYHIQRRSAAGGGTVTFIISDGVALSVVDTAAVIGAGSWNFFVGRFIPSTQIDVFHNGAQATNAVGIPAAIQDIAGQFAIGARGDPANYHDGKASLCWLCAAALSGSIIGALYQNTRKAFNV